jgi:TRAP transporter 4TM/12TM fusion protein
VITGLNRAYCAFLLVGGVVWALDLFLWLGFSLIEAEWLGPYLGVATAASFLHAPYTRRAGSVEVLAGLAAIACWFWLGWNYNAWLIDYDGFTPDKYLPGALAIALMVEGLRKSCGLPISLLVWGLIAYSVFGYALPQPWQADRLSLEALVTYLYTDSNAIPGLVLVIIASLVLAFIVFGKLMEISGATAFFTDLAMALMGSRRGGPAKVSVVASSMMGSISGSPVGNIMSTGVVTIPLMKRTGFRASHAAAIEAVASTGGQIAPPVMGATAFLMAEFLQISYFEVAKAALLPAVFYYLCLFLQVDAMAHREGLKGMPRSTLPRLLPTLRIGWIFIVPIGMLIYLLFWRGRSPASAALGAAALLLGLALLRGRFLSRRDWAELIFGGGRSMVPLVLIGGGAGVVIGVMNVTGLGQSLAFVLVQVGADWGLFVMLLITALLSIVLGMGMPSTAIYVVLASIIAPALMEMGVAAMAAHLFIFYFGVLSFLTPPVAVSSYVAAGLAGANMWQTSWVGMRLAAVAFLLPFVWAYDSALLLEGSWFGILVVTCTTAAAILLITKGVESVRSRSVWGFAYGAALTATVVAIGTAPIWMGGESPWALAAGATGVLVYWLLPKGRAYAS